MPVLTHEEVQGGNRSLLQDFCDRCHGQFAFVFDGKSKRYQLACASCGHPAPDDHPEQVKLKRDYEDREKRDREEQQKQAKAAEMKNGNSYIPPLAVLEDRLQALERKSAEQDTIIAQQAQIISELSKASKRGQK